MTKTVTNCLIDLGITNATLFDPFDSLEQEFNNVIKKTWRLKVLREHPVSKVAKFFVYFFKFGIESEFMVTIKKKVDK